MTQPRGAGDIAFVYATLLTAEPDQQSFAVRRATLIDRTVRSIRHEALSNTLSGAGYDRWSGNTWQASSPWAWISVRSSRVRDTNVGDVSGSP